jgi:DNA-binding phage protein
VKTKLKTTPFDATDYLTSEEECALFLESAEIPADEDGKSAL